VSYCEIHLSKLYWIQVFVILNMKTKQGCRLSHRQKITIVDCRMICLLNSTTVCNSFAILSYPFTVFTLVYIRTYITVNFDLSVKCLNC